MTTSSNNAIAATSPTTANNIVLVIGTLILCSLPFVMSGSTPPSVLEKVQQRGYLQLVTKNGPATFYEGAFGHAGFEYELAQDFADQLGVELVVNDQPSLNDILQAIKTGNGHFAAAGITNPDKHNGQTTFSIPYSTVTPQVVYQRDTPRPKTLEDLAEREVIIASNSGHQSFLTELQNEYPNIQWQKRPDKDMEGLLELVHNGEAEVALVDSTVFIANSVIYPRARSAFFIGEPQEIVWAFPKQGDDSLLINANRFLRQSLATGKITDLEKKYFSEPAVEESHALEFIQRIEERLPEWTPLFQKSAKGKGLDWLFLAAISYQESLWNKDARSFTGVRGLMMLTNATAKELGIQDRTDPEQSIEGGARYFVETRNRIPKDITEPDRTWMALAAYNVGMGHLEDARVITEQQGGNPDKWEDVEQRLPLLASSKYYRNTKHGYARGWEPVQYVEKIRTYHNILVWHFAGKENEIAQVSQ